MENYLKSLLNSFQDLIFILDSNGVFVEYLGNDQSPDLLVKKSEFIGKHYEVILPSTISQQLKIGFVKIDTQSHQFEYSLPFPEGERWFSAILSQFDGIRGKQILLVARNITKAKQQEILNESILNSSVSGILAFTTLRNSNGEIEDFVFTKINKAAEKILDIQISESIGKRFLEKFPHLKQGGLLEKFTETVETGKVLDFEYFSAFSGFGPTWYHIIATKMEDGFVASFENITFRKIAEDKLRASESVNKLLTDNMLDLVALHDPDGTYVYVSPSVEKLLGYKPEELIGTNPYLLFHTDDLQRIKESSHKPLLEGQEDINDIQYQIKTKAGKYIWFETNTKAILDNSGNILKLQTISRNVTRRKALEIELTEAYNNIQTIFNASTIIAFISTDTQGTIKSFNTGAEQLLGYKAEEVINTHTPMLFHLPEEVLEHSKELSKEFNKEIQGFETFTIKAKQGNYEEREWTYVHKNGNYIDVNLTVTAIRNTRNEITGYLGVANDITERKKIELAIKASEKKYRTIFQNIKDIFFRTDANGIVTEVSPSVQLHSDFTPEEVIGKSVEDFYYHLEDRARLREALHQSNEINDFEVRLKNKKGRLIYISINTHLNFDENGNHIGSEGIMRDITERKKSEDAIVKLNQELEALNRQKTKLFSIISHDLRGPMANTISLMDILHHDLQSLSQAEMQSFLDLLRKSANNAFSLLEDLLLWTRNQFEKIAFVPITLKFSEQLNNVLSNLESSIDAKRLKVNVEVPAGLIITADQDMLKTILRNLISNAIKFSYENSEIEVKAKMIGSDIMVTIKDNGMGIEEENLPEIFNKSSLFTTYGTKGEKGSGLGLDLCLDFVEKHHGNIWVESVHGKGAAFKFTLPQGNF